MQKPSDTSVLVRYYRENETEKPIPNMSVSDFFAYRSVIPNSRFKPNAHPQMEYADRSLNGIWRQIPGVSVVFIVCFHRVTVFVTMCKQKSLPSELILSLDSERDHSWCANQRRSLSAMGADLL